MLSCRYDQATDCSAQQVWMDSAARYELPLQQLQLSPDDIREYYDNASCREVDQQASCW
jgi:hypothetical protein